MWLQAIFVVLMVCTQMNVGHDHGHAHGSHGHTHGSHGHTHGSHGHAHGSHGHAHGSHGHAHGSHGHTHGQKHVKEEHHDHGHDDDHGHDHAEEPHFKWSKKANVKENEHDSSKLKDPAKHHEESNKHINHIHAEGHGHSHSSYENDKQKKQSESHLHSQSNSKDVKVENTYTPPISEPVLWFEPLLATGLISAAPFLILFVVPINSNSEENKPFLKVLLAFASGGLLGDALLHLIPHAISPHSHGGDISKTHSHSHNHIEGHDHSGDMLVGMWVLIGLITFLVVEKLVRHVKGGHGHSHASHTKSTDKKNDDPKETKVKEEIKKDGEHKKKVSVKKEDIKVTAYLNLAADCTHNFTDGLAIGVSFLVSRNVGFITTLTIFLHEIPHEIGDFAILIQSGCTKRKAMSLQLVTAVGAFAGCICGLLAEGLGTAASSWILPFTAGGFIYIATVSVIPELLEETNIKQSIKEIFALLVGVLLMVIIATME